jgi:hypothetical protein
MLDWFDIKILDRDMRILYDLVAVSTKLTEGELQS